MNQLSSNKLGRESNLITAWKVALYLALTGNFFPYCSGCRAPEQRDFQEAVHWVQQYSVVDIIGGVGGPPGEYPVSYEKWMQQGQQIPHIRESLQTLLKQRAPDVELPTVAYALGEFGNQHSVPVLIDALGSEDDLLRLEAAVALGSLRAAEAVEALCEILNNDEYANVRANAAVALRQIGDCRARFALERALNDPDEFVSRLAARALAQLGEASDAERNNAKSGRKNGT